MASSPPHPSDRQLYLPTTGKVLRIGASESAFFEHLFLDISLKWERDKLFQTSFMLMCRLYRVHPHLVTPEVAKAFVTFLDSRSGHMRLSEIGMTAAVLQLALPPHLQRLWDVVCSHEPTKRTRRYERDMMRSLKREHVVELLDMLGFFVTE